MLQAKPSEPVLLRVPAHLFADLQKALAKCGYNLRDIRGGNNHYKVEIIPQIIRKHDER